MTTYLDRTTEANVIPIIIAAHTLGALKSNMALLGLVNKNYRNEVAAKGDTVDIGVRGTLSVNDKADNTDVTMQAPTTTKLSVQLDKYKEVTYGIEDIARMQASNDAILEYANDAAIILLEQMESDIAALYSGFSQTIDDTTGLGEDDFREARRQFNSAKVPTRGRWAVLHEDAEYEALAIEKLINKDYKESLGNIMGANYIGDFAGFSIFMDQNIKVASSVCKNLFGHRDAIALISRPMRVTKSPNVVQVVMQEDGISLRVTQWYDPNGKAEVMSIDTLYGVAELRDNHAIVVSTTEI